MYEKNTLFIIGAGASAELGLPTGARLINDISQRLDIRFQDGIRQVSGDSVIFDALRSHVSSLTEYWKTNQTQELIEAPSLNSYQQSCWQIRDAMPQAISIDNFLDTHQGNEKIKISGKLAIARSILEAEKNSILNVDNETEKIDFSSIKDTWLHPFFQIAHQGLAKEDVGAFLSDVSFINFNYDRCLEHYLVYALPNYFGISREESENIVKRLDIIHPYGTVGYLPWQEKGAIAPFGNVKHPSNLLKIASQIKTFTEQIEEESTVERLKTTVSEATTIVFLGFAYHPQNMKLISPEPKIEEKHGVQVLGTALGVSESDCTALHDEIPEWLGRDSRRVYRYIHRECGCTNLFHEHRRRLSQSI